MLASVYKKRFSNGREPWSSGNGKRLTFWRLWVWIPAPYTGWTFFTYICYKKCYDVCLKRPKINEKEAGVVTFFKKRFSYHFPEQAKKMKNWFIFFALGLSPSLQCDCYFLFLWKGFCRSRRSKKKEERTVVLLVHSCY